MDKLRKIVAWVWLNKERMVLLVMVGFLCYRVYEVVNPPEKDMGGPLSPPKAALPEDPAGRTMLAQENVLPPAPPARPPVDGPEDVSSLYRRHPFWYSSSTATADGGAAEEEVDVELLNIQEISGRLRARLRTGNTRQWYDEGEEFQEYTLEDIDAEAGTVTIFVERLDGRITRSLPSATEG